MATSKLRGFYQLFKKDWDMVKTGTYFVLALALTTNLAVVVFRIQQVAPLFAFTFMAPFLVPLYSAVQLFRREWSGGSIYLLLSLPIKGFYIFLSKLLAILLEFIVQSIGVFSISFIFIYTFEMSSKINLYQILNFSYTSNALFAGVLTYLILLGGLALFTGGTFLSQALSRLVPKYQDLCAFAFFLVSLWFAAKVTTNLGNYLLHLNWMSTPRSPMSLWLPASFIILLEVSIAVVYLAGAGYIYDRKLEL